jgi:apolipoprotein N-acyltransferase
MFGLSLGLSFLLVAFGQPARVAAFGVLAGWIGLALFWKSMLHLSSARNRFWLASFWFAGVQMVQLSWMATTQYMGPLILAVYVCVILALGLQFGVLSMYLSLKTNIGQRPILSINFLGMLAMAGTWVLFEWVRLFTCTGFTWNPVGLFLSCSTYSLQAASLFGIYGLSFWVVLVNVAALRVLLAPFSKKHCAVFCVLAALPYSFGFVYMHVLDTKENPSLQAILVQTALMPEQKQYDRSQPIAFIPVMEQWDRILEIVRKNDRKTPDLIVLPESALPYGAYKYGYDLQLVKEIWIKHFGVEALSDLPLLRRPFAFLENKRWKVTNAYWAQALSNHYKADLIVGLDDEQYNAAFLFCSKEKIPQRYEKRILVPVGEYIPFQKIRFIGRFIASQFGISQSFFPGSGAKILLGKLPFAVSICYEETFSALIREARLQGAQCFVNITNDAWYPSSKLAQQHFDHGMIRSVENGVSVIRASNTGVTGGVDRFGRVIALLEPHEQVAAGLAITIPVSFHDTLYTLWGDAAILVLSLFFILIFCAMRLFVNKKLL